jgi:hypothetical protein
MDLDAVLWLVWLMVVAVSAVRWWRIPQTRPASEVALWFSASLAAWQLVDLVGVRGSVLQFLLGIAGLACTLVGVYRIFKLAEDKQSHRSGASRDR